MSCRLRFVLKFISLAFSNPLSTRLAASEANNIRLEVTDIDGAKTTFGRLAVVTKATFYTTWQLSTTTIRGISQPKQNINKLHVTLSFKHTKHDLIALYFFIQKISSRMGGFRSRIFR